MWTFADFDALSDQAEMGPAARDLIRSRALPAFHVLSEGKAEEGLGATRFGGLPDLPPGSEWPLTSDGERLQFLAQLDLSDIGRRCGPSELPQSGLLSLFAGGLNDPANFAVEVRFNAPGSQLTRLQPPEGAVKPNTWRKALNPVGVSFEPTVTIPYDTFFDDDIEAAAPGCELYDLLEEHPERRIGQLLGCNSSMADDLHAFMAMAELGYPRKDPLLTWKTWEAWEGAKQMTTKFRNGEVYRPWSENDDDVVRWILANRERIVAEIAQWRVLLEVESNNDMALSVGDAGSIFILIRSDDLKARNFERVRAVTTSC